MATCTKRQRPPDGRAICHQRFMAHYGLPGAKRGGAIAVSHFTKLSSSSRREAEAYRGAASKFEGA